MNDQTIGDVVGELAQLLTGRFLGRVFQIDDYSIAIDFGLKGDGFLFISVNPSAPRLYLIKRTTRQLQKLSTHPSALVQTLKAKIAGAHASLITKDPGERIVRFRFNASDEPYTLIAQLTGRSANLFLMDSSGVITDALRVTKGPGQHIGDVYQTPSQDSRSGKETKIATAGGSSISETLDKHYQQLDRDLEIQATGKRLLNDLRRELGKRKRLKANLEKDLVEHGNPEEHKRLGDLLLANTATAQRSGDTVSLVDYYSEGAPRIDVNIDSDATLQEAASESFSRYTKSKRAVEEIRRRFVEIENEIKEIAARQAKVEQAIETGDESTLIEFTSREVNRPVSAKKKQKDQSLAGLRRYRSSDGYEVLVGRSSRDNDKLTFRVARPNDLWLHTGDYPGSHVIIRNSTRKEIPHRTVVEAAQLAAKFSQASNDSKVTVHYTPRKFLTKPKGAAPGLVRLSTFRAITVEPKEMMERES